MKKSLGGYGYSTIETGMELLSSMERGETAKGSREFSQPLLSNNSGEHFISADQKLTNDKSTKRAEKLSDDSRFPSANANLTHKKDGLSWYELFRVLFPYFWPNAGTDGAVINRIRSTSTWLMVALSKTCNLTAPLFLSAATNHLLSGNYPAAATSMICFSVLRFCASAFKELQSIIYIKVKQQASIQLQEITFTHLHRLSLNWHLSKKTGSVMKSMDRGVEAANQLISSMFLLLLPAFLECFAVVVFFFIMYRQSLLGGIVLIGVSLYTVATILITRTRKKFREQKNKHDNEFHDKATDSIINYETVNTTTRPRSSCSGY
eukprot:gene25480-34032_t